MLVAAVSVLLTVTTLLLLAPVAIYCVEVVAGCWPQQRPWLPVTRAARPRVAVLIPAHNEAEGIAATLQIIQSQLLPGDELLVVADNCSDNTADVARGLGATVLERSDASRRGKGYALAFGLDHLALDPPDAVLLFDADCRVSSHCIEVLARRAIESQRPLQSLYLCKATGAGGKQQMLSSLAFRFKNLIRTVGLAKLGGPCHLTGSGMAIAWPLIEKVKWASGNVVEDMQLGIDYALAGHPPLFVPEAEVLSDLPVSSGGMLAQRRRWEHGSLGTALSQSPRLAWQGIRRGSWPLVALALDLMVPPLALLTMGIGALTVATLALWLVGGGAVPLLLVTLAAVSFAATTALGWSTHCRQIVPAKSFLAVPGYLFAKIPLYAGFLFRPEKQWVRAERAAH